jgi:hypothetical protein
MVSTILLDSIRLIIIDAMTVISGFIRFLLTVNTVITVEADGCMLTFLGLTPVFGVFSLILLTGFRQLETVASEIGVYHVLR